MIPWCYRRICCAKNESTVHNSKVNRWFKKFCLACKHLDNQVSSGRPKTMDSLAMLYAIETNLASGTWRVSGEFHISQSSIVYHLCNLSSSIWRCQIMIHVIKILQNFYSSFWYSIRFIIIFDNRNIIWNIF